MQGQPRDAAAHDLGDLQGTAVDGDVLAGLGDARQVGDDEAGDGGVATVGKGDAGGRGEILEAGSPP